MIWTTILMALREIRRNGLRSLLTMLGVVIGVGAVIALVSVGRGATAKVTEDIAKLGKNLLTVSAGTFSRGGGGAGINAPPLRLDDAAAIRAEILGVQAVAAAAASSQQVVFGNSNQRSSITSCVRAESRVPVGSSAIRISGSVTSARAMATRCCWPPESWLGAWPTRSERPTSDSARSARS